MLVWLFGNPGINNDGIKPVDGSSHIGVSGYKIYVIS